MFCWLIGHKKFLNGRYRNYLNAFIEYWHCERCNQYWKKIIYINSKTGVKTGELDI